jgi:hypothetical protein
MEWFYKPIACNYLQLRSVFILGLRDGTVALRDISADTGSF